MYEESVIWFKVVHVKKLTKKQEKEDTKSSVNIHARKSKIYMTAKMKHKQFMSSVKHT